MNIVRRLTRSQLSFIVSTTWIIAAFALIVTAGLGYMNATVAFWMVVYCVVVSVAFWDW